MLERKLQKDKGHRFLCWDALIIISFMLVFVACFSLGWKVKKNKLLKYFGFISSAFTSAVENMKV